MLLDIFSTSSDENKLLKEIVTNQCIESCMEELNALLYMITQMEEEKAKTVLNSFYDALNKKMIHKEHFIEPYFVGDKDYAVSNILYRRMFKEDRIEKAGEYFHDAIDFLEENFYSCYKVSVSKGELENILEYLDKEYDYFASVYEDCFHLFVIMQCEGVEEKMLCLPPDGDEEVCMHIITAPKDEQLAIITKEYSVIKLLVKDAYQFCFDNTPEYPDCVIELAESHGLHIELEENESVEDAYIDHIAFALWADLYFRKSESERNIYDGYLLSLKVLFKSIVRLCQERKLRIQRENVLSNEHSITG